VSATVELRLVDGDGEVRLVDGDGEVRRITRRIVLRR
jgi:hypothetical protein